MAWTYSGDPGSSTKDTVRFLIGDTSSKEPLLQDAEISYLLGLYNNAPNNAAIRCCEVIMAKFSRLMDESVGQVHITYSQRAEAYRKMRVDLVNRLGVQDMRPYAGGISRSDQETNALNTDRVKPVFRQHMMENQQLSPWVTGNLDSIGNLVGDND